MFGVLAFLLDDSYKFNILIECTISESLFYISFIINLE